MKSVFLTLTILKFLMVCSLSHANDWVPPAPNRQNDGFDWIELKSGEWLKGKVKSMQDGKLEFDSEELDIHVWDWSDIRTLRSSRSQKFGFNDKHNVDGAVFVDRNEVTIVNKEGTVTRPRAQLMAITPTGNRERDKWSIDVSAGINSRQGNVEEFNNNTQVTLRRFTPQTRQKVEYLGNYGKLENNVSKDDQRWLANSDFFLSRRLFIRAPDLEYFHDSQQNLDYRLTLGSSVGYDIIKTPRTEWQVTAGPAFQKNQFESVEAGKDDAASSGALVLGSYFEIELTKKIDYELDYRGQFAGRKAGSNMHHVVSTFEFEIHKQLTLDLSLVWDRIADPETGDDGIKPKSDDFQFITSLGVHF